MRRREKELVAALARMTETCRHPVTRAGMPERCGEQATAIIWGKLSDPDDLGPKCDRHWPKALARGRIDQYAAFDLRPALAALSDNATSSITVHTKEFKMPGDDDD